MKFYIASAIKNKDKVQAIYEELKKRGDEVTTDWTLTDDIPENDREKSGVFYYRK